MTRLFYITILLLGCANADPSTSPLLRADRTVKSGTGEIADTLNAGTYTYVRMQDEKHWHVVASGSPEIGDRVRYRTYARISDFESARLNRTFQNLSFTILQKENP